MSPHSSASRVKLRVLRAGRQMALRCPTVGSDAAAVRRRLEMQNRPRCCLHVQRRFPVSYKEGFSHFPVWAIFANSEDVDFESFRVWLYLWVVARHVISQRCVRGFVSCISQVLVKPQSHASSRLADVCVTVVLPCTEFA